MNERITEAIVRDHFKKDNTIKNIIFEEQQSNNPKINKLLQNASKNGLGSGKPEFIITFKNNTEFLIVIECKADITKHESANHENYSNYAVDGALLYSSFLSKEYDVLSIAVSGEDESNLRISHYLQLKGEKQIHSIFGQKLLSLNTYLSGYKNSGMKFHQDYGKLMQFLKDLNEELHSYKVKESHRSLLISGILIALEDNVFIKGYKEYSNSKRLAKFLVDTIENQLISSLNQQKAENLALSYSFIQSHSLLSNDIEKLKKIITDINDEVNSFMKTYHYYDVLGQFYIEFLRYANNDKGLGIVLTPPHITELFTEIASVDENSVVLDNCTGTSGFLISSMKKMIDEANHDESKIDEIKSNQIIGIEYQDDIFALACSNMFIHGDGKSNLIYEDCFNEDVKNLVKEYKPNIGFLNPPYKKSKDDIEEIDFVLNNLDMLEKGGICVAIVPMRCALYNKGKGLELKRKILGKHTLEAVFSMPDELFFNSDTGVVTCVMVIKAHYQHPDGYETYFGYWKDDGFEKRKIMGRADYKGKWNSIKDKWLRNFKNKNEIIGHSVKKEVEAKDEWCVEAYMKTDYSKLTKQDFEKTLQNYVGYQFLNEN